MIPGTETASKVLTNIRKRDASGQVSKSILRRRGDRRVHFSNLSSVHLPKPIPVLTASDPDGQKVIRSTVGRFLEEEDFRTFPRGKGFLLAGKFLKVGQARKDFVVVRAPPAGVPHRRGR